MIELYISAEENGKRGAYTKADMLANEMGYRVLKIEHTMVSKSGSTSTPYSSTWGQSEPGYLITVETNWRREPYERVEIPQIVEKI